jgi:DNA-binding MarR family transcriptional regulator
MNNIQDAQPAQFLKAVQGPKPPPTIDRLGAKVAYAVILHYAWNKDSCFPGQDRLAEAMGMSKSRVNEFIKALEKIGPIESICSTWCEDGFSL